MKILRSWLAEYVDLKDRQNDVLAADLESLGHEVESWQNFGLTGVVIGEVLEVKEHPNADRLRIAIVSIGTEQLTIVCGAPNLAVGQKVPVALIGSTLPGGLIIEERPIRNVVSSGMLCAADELGLSDDHDGLLVLPKDAVVGAPFGDSADTVFDLAITPNRGDVLSHVGMARELAALWDQDLHELDTMPKLDETLSDVDIVIENPEDTPRYTARLVTDFASRGVSEKIQERLRAIGHSTYHPIVDITNYVMEDIGAPLHAFDADKIELPLEVRRAKIGESIILLNDQSYDLDGSVLVIADQRGPIALAGIMGGKESAISKETRRVILESAYFKPSIVRQTKHRFKISSDAGYRFERGTDPNGIEKASQRAASIILEQLGAKVGPLTIKGEMISRPSIVFDTAKINSRLGSQYSNGEMSDIFGRLGFVIQDDHILVSSWRHDVSIIEDLAEEVARIKGYDHLPRTPLDGIKEPLALPENTRYKLIQQLKDKLSRAGWTEHVGSSFISSEEAALFGISDELIPLKNPVNPDSAFLRPNLTLSLSRAIAKNPLFGTVKFFEIGTVFSTNYHEALAIGLAWTGDIDLEEIRSFVPITEPSSKQFALAEETKQFYKIRRSVQILADIVDFKKLAEITSDSDEVTGVAPIFVAHMPSKYQATIRDIALIVPKAVSVDTIRTELSSVSGVVDVELFDVFESAQLGENHSLAFHLLFELPDRSLTNEEIDIAMREAGASLANKFGATVR